MKLVYTLIVAVILAIPCSAQAYYIEFSGNSLNSGIFSSRSIDNGVSLDATNLQEYIMFRGALTIFSDYGRDIERLVDVSFSQFVTVAGVSSATSTLMIDGMVKLVDHYWPTTYGLESFSNVDDLEPLYTGTIYEFMYGIGPGNILDADIDIVVTSADAPAPTPLPGAVWLLGSGLVGLVGLRRKMNA
ncbi:VPLPA-CTERM sorting domain-containing protein [Pseudodesulfovibrio sp. zrk46]|uniref:VPLPA-CTERM sorting domain-containing protein n=1 Tax=Pseudodesulfovibrio sp. zrk46 TaxID=2725288 RepID=UPI0014491CE5|nr:VPLPA-CTERM sorting domain-containing protein [Pseudodesulfovibrio sp. zrk46]QJB55505.1 hypothetical protein HFN16_03450 [Pseudodesulfovibrio sp. zrk46]